MEDLSRRVSEAERSRDDLMMKVENLSHDVEKERDEYVPFSLFKYAGRAFTSDMKFVLDIRSYQ